MAQTMVNFRMEEELKRSMEAVCADMGLSMTAAFTIFAKKVARERRIPFEVTADAFYSERSMEYLTRLIEGIENGRARLEEHELIEEDE